jgi:hypothetical protein
MPANSAASCSGWSKKTSCAEFSNQIIRFPQLANILLAACLLTVPAPALVAWLIFRTVRRRKTPAKSQAQPSHPAFTAGLPGVRR